MNASGLEIVWQNDPERGITDPVLEETGRAFVLRLYRGKFIDKALGNWFNAPYPRIVFIWTMCLMPFIAWRWPFRWRGKAKAGYLGFKCYGVDSDAYLEWLAKKHVYPGSLACCLTFRPFATIR